MMHGKPAQLKHVLIPACVSFIDHNYMNEISPAGEAIRGSLGNRPIIFCERPLSRPSHCNPHA
jgi:hypothetical protein